MSERTFVLIFFFWAVLTVVTPTLILLSESSKADLLDVNGNHLLKVQTPAAEKGGRVMARRMIGYTEKQFTTARKAPESLSSAPLLALVSKIKEFLSTKFFEKQQFR